MRRSGRWGCSGSRPWPCVPRRGTRRRRAIRRDPSRWWCPSRPAVRATSSRASSPSRWGRSLGQSMVIENVGGAGGTIGSARVAAAHPDGYTLLAGSMGSHVAAPVLTPNVKYDSERDFEPIGFTAHAPAVIVAQQGFSRQGPARIRRLPEKERRQASSRRMAASARRRTWRVCLFTTQAGVQPGLVAYRGTGPALNDLDRRPCRFLLRAGGERRAADQRRHDQGLRRVGERTPGDPARRPDREGSRHRLSDEHLGRHLCAQGHAEGRSSTSSPSALDQALDDPGVRSGCPTSADRCPARTSARRRSSTPS